MTRVSIIKYLKHFAVLAALGAVSVLLVALLQLVGTFNVSTLPLVWQGVAFLFLPLVVAAGVKLQSEITAEIAAEEAQKSLAIETVKNALLMKELVNVKNMTFNKPSLDIGNKGPVY